MINAADRYTVESVWRSMALCTALIANPTFIDWWVPAREQYRIPSYPALHPVLCPVLSNMSTRMSAHRSTHTSTCMSSSMPTLMSSIIFRHVYICICTDICIDICIDMCANMCTGTLHTPPSIAPVWARRETSIKRLLVSHLIQTEIIGMRPASFALGTSWIRVFLASRL